MGINVEKEQVANAMSPMDSDIPTFEAANGRSASGVEPERNAIFDNLVQVEGEVAGLIAYSIYKQNKRAWLQDFQKAVGRPPTEAETRAYIIGESTERRLATYRHLAQATLLGQGPEAPTGMKRVGNLQSRSASFYLIWAVVLIVALAVLGFALHSGLAVTTPK